MATRSCGTLAQAGCLRADSRPEEGSEDARCHFGRWDLDKPETLPEAFDGAKTLFLLTHYLDDMVALQHNAIAAARAAGVTHVVKVSAFAASDHSKGADRSMALSRREGTAGIWAGLDDAAASHTISCRIC